MNSLQGENAPCWSVLHVRSRCEKKVAEYAAGYGIEYYLPLREERKRYQRRWVVVQKPLFPGYVFTCFTPDQRQELIKNSQIVRLLVVEDQHHFLGELEQIRQALSIDSSLGVSPIPKAGKRVRILAGPFQGLEGIVSTQHGETRVFLTVEMIGQAVSVSAEIDTLEQIE